eukprot:GHVU01125948.1.p1 GENE.GHVU01125948.1~~GHVU01125948.1.p1  ORF type:complete len:253 (-),score=10.76 GHVU01125948.1:193-951(-)
MAVVSTSQISREAFAALRTSLLSLQELAWLVAVSGQSRDRNYHSGLILALGFQTLLPTGDLLERVRAAFPRGRRLTSGAHVGNFQSTAGRWAKGSAPAGLPRKGFYEMFPAPAGEPVLPWRELNVELPNRVVWRGVSWVTAAITAFDHEQILPWVVRPANEVGARLTNTPFSIRPPTHIPVLPVHRDPNALVLPFVEDDPEHMNDGPIAVRGNTMEGDDDTQDGGAAVPIPGTPRRVGGQQRQGGGVDVGAS